MKTFNTLDPTNRPPLVMLVYGEGGVGKSTFASTAPKPFMADCEGGSKYFGLRNVALMGAHIEKWNDMKDFISHVLDPKQGIETIVIDPIGELMEKLKRFMVAQGDSKQVQKDGSPTAAGWGWLKDTMRNTLKLFRDSGKNVILVAHVDEQSDDGRLVKRPMIQTKLSAEIVNMVDVVGYMTTVVRDGETVRVILVDAESDKYTAKDRTGQLGKTIPPDFGKILAATQGTASFAWSKKPVAAATEIAASGKDAQQAPSDEAANAGSETEEPKRLSNPHLQAAREKIQRQGQEAAA